jgi:hypothetical protein
MCLVRLASGHFSPLLTVACYLYNNNVPAVVIFRATVYVIIFVDLTGICRNKCVAVSLNLCSMKIELVILLNGGFKCDMIELCFGTCIARHLVSGVNIRNFQGN